MISFIVERSAISKEVINERCKQKNEYNLASNLQCLPAQKPRIQQQQPFLQPKVQARVHEPPVEHGD